MRHTGSRPSFVAAITLLLVIFTAASATRANAQTPRGGSAAAGPRAAAGARAPATRPSRPLCWTWFLSQSRSAPQSARP